MSYVIDRRLNAKKHNAVNRQRFLERYKKHIQRAVSDAVSNRSITDMERGEEISIPADDISEPRFHHGPGGERTGVHPGNKEFLAGDKIKRPDGGGAGGSGGDAADSGEGNDEFVFTLSQQEFLEFLFEDLALPNLTKRTLKGDNNFQRKHAGFATDGLPSKLSVVRSWQAAKSRRIALSGRSRKRLRKAKESIDIARITGDELGVRRYTEEALMLERRIRKIPFLDTTDLRYRLQVTKPVPTSQAVMFCLMDVSGSMDQQIKELAKRFYLLLYLFLNKYYEKTEVVFIRHHTIAKEVDEQEFFYSRETGGTVVSSALKLMQDIIAARYSSEQWNIYGAQASDGDNWQDDSPKCVEMLQSKILPQVQHFSYVEIGNRAHQALWLEYEKMATQFPTTFAQQQIREAGDIFSVFHALFHKRAAA